MYGCTVVLAEVLVLPLGEETESVKEIARGLVQAHVPHLCHANAQKSEVRRIKHYCPAKPQVCALLGHGVGVSS